MPLIDSLTAMNSHDDIKPSEPPPSYDEVINESTGGSYSRPNPPPPQPPRPETLRPPQPPRPSNSSHSSYNSPGPQRPPNTAQNTNSLYTTNQNLPFQYPKGFLCQKCRNSGYKIKNGKLCRDCWDRFYLKNNAYNPNPQLPFKFPKRYMCEKCNNSGYKIKNGRSCKDCWERFSPRNGYQPVSSLLSFNPLFTTLTVSMSPMLPYRPAPGPGPSLPPMRVNPGDPRIGGTLCGRCRGSGLITFFLDDELCPVCNGIGRILSGPPMQPPRNPGPPPGQYHPGPPGGPYGPNPYMGGKY
ncbi:uncharacterized protein AC631_04385 [Debaryomyces fabryi]|uniref:Proline-rich protein HUA1 n=1 Tax=Debaryomyces fabryi TaxID=58627 RepID=A0A0V1PUY5_9ASCO|nr:uncharacterized protein AC631_04385 [Debaryomyces fabryi]KRZ99867.1 hypothetical protein AC631_04385 [Debaryomyces fabryi]CUM54451.1 unnamed protein product [Debaryomyces fabryi]